MDHDQPAKVGDHAWLREQIALIEARRAETQMFAPREERLLPPLMPSLMLMLAAGAAVFGAGMAFGAFVLP